MLPIMAHRRPTRVAPRVLGRSVLFTKMRPRPHDVAMTTTLITGANKGLGRETARRLLADGHEVWLGARDPGRGRAAAHELGGRFIELDVTDQASVDGAVGQVSSESGGLDVLINNAGISGGFKPAGDTGPEDFRLVFETNLFGVVRVSQAFLALLMRSSNPVIVNVSSGMGSLAVTTDPARFESKLTGLAYPASKAALNMITSQYAKAFPQMRINAVDPGYTATDLNGNRGTQSVEEGADVIARMAKVAASGPTGGFFDARGTVPW
jgi:NAD(P)-dependent dehydrogenase (short-subunit alcohol dehydrogenase family)